METDDDTPATAVAPPKPCGPEDSAFWTWLARELARFYAPLYAERVQNSPILLQDQGGAMAFRIISDDTEGDHGHTYSGKDGNTASAIGRNLQELVEFLIKARQHEVKEEARRASEHASDPNIEPNRLPDDDVEPEAGPIDPWMSFADTCQLLISYDVGNNTANNACLGLAVDIFCMWREQGRPDQLNPLHPPWSETMHDTYQELRL
ncbi:hypothetical protein SCUCBS95973_003952 [Sporothrix curviconia]|uniref:Uncharacterized protein n=1 Tax=Sporothrix curviconia TaxID=1260050 RepID=A0ABP0BK35_9PEZI